MNPAQPRPTKQLHVPSATRKRVVAQEHARHLLANLE